MLYDRHLVTLSLEGRSADSRRNLFDAKRKLLAAYVAYRLEDGRKY